ncbi:MAG: tetratricopeptide repeat protein [Spirochaetes bacterium]|nr:tetratricopeptide repeat protein [Spirochaetota bacterium]
MRNEVSRATSVASRRGVDEFFLESGGADPRPPFIRVIASESGAQRTIVVTLNTVDDRQSSLLLYAAWDGYLNRALSQAIEYLAAAYHEFPSRESHSAPRLVDELRLDRVPAPPEFPGPKGIYPAGVASKRNGALVIAGSTFAIEMDQARRITDYPGASLLARGEYGFAQAVATTPAGTTYMRGASGPYAYRFAPTNSEAERIPTSIAGPGSLAALTDGSLVLTDTVNRRGLRIEDRQSTEFPIFPHANSFLTAMTGAPDGNVWAFDPGERRIYIYSPEGSIVDTIMPQLPAADGASTVALAVYRDLHFVLLTRTGLFKFTRTGNPVWRMTSLPGLPAASFSGFSSLAVDSDAGAIYLVDTTRRSLVHLYDSSATGMDQIPSDFFRELAEARAALAESPQALEPLKHRARHYAEAGAVAAAEAAWSDVLDFHPRDGEAKEALERIALDRLFRAGMRLAEEARRDLNALGPASARERYGEALRRFEELLARDPFYPEAQETADRIRRERRGLNEHAATQAPLEFLNVRVDNLFPSLIARYQSRPIGEAEILNTGDEELTDLRVLVTLPRYSDSPREAASVERVAPGASVEVPLYVSLNTEALTLEEDLPVTLSLEARGRRGEASVTVRTSAASTLYRRSAMQWTDTAWLASFVTPNEATVARFALAVGDIGENEILPRPVYRAMRISDALGAYRVYYVEDPDTPISEILGREDVVDTVRVPRSTLLYRAGDCDDTTALLCSLLEASGVSTAFVTTPDHVLMAFDTGEPSVNAWRFEGTDRHVFTSGGTVWIPLETTVLHQGFRGAWRAATRRIGSIPESSSVGFMAVGNARTEYAALPLPPQDPAILPPASESLRTAFKTAADTLHAELYEGALADRQELLENTSGRTRGPILSQIAGLHTAFGELNAAKAALEEGLELAPSSSILRTNLAQVYLLQDKPQEAIAQLERVRERRPSSPLVLALLARAYLANGNAAQAVALAERVRAVAPELAVGLPDSEGSSRRAGEAGGGGGGRRYPLLWPNDEESLD